MRGREVGFVDGGDPSHGWLPVICCKPAQIRSVGMGGGWGMMPELLTSAVNIKAHGCDLNMCMLRDEARDQRC